jgi:hypothetical protein
MIYNETFAQHPLMSASLFFIFALIIGLLAMLVGNRSKINNSK